MKRNVEVLIFTVLMASSFSILSFAQDNQTSQQPAAAQGNTTVVPAAPDKPAPTEWLYGEINSVDLTAKSLVLTYLDYDTDIEKQATVYTDAKTIFENVKSLEEIKPQDMVSIDYVTGADSKNLAVSISVEKPENIDDLDTENSTPAETKQQIKPAVEAPAVSAAADNGTGTDNEQ